MDPASSGELFRPLSSFRLPEFNPAKVIARRVAMELRSGWAVNIGFCRSANVPRVLIEEGLHGAVAWVIEQGAVGRVPLLDFKFGGVSNAVACVASPHQFIYVQAGGGSIARCCADLRRLAGHIAGIVDFQSFANVSVELALVRRFGDLLWFDVRYAAVRDVYLGDAAHQAVGGRIVSALEGGAEGVSVFDLALP